GLSPLATIPQCHGCGHLERQLGGVDLVIRPVVENSPYPEHRITGNDTRCHSFSKPCLYRGDILLRDGTADNPVFEFESGVRSKWDKLYQAMAILASAAGLLDKSALRLH